MKTAVATLDDIPDWNRGRVVIPQGLLHFCWETLLNVLEGHISVASEQQMVWAGWIDAAGMCLGEAGCHNSTVTSPSLTAVICCSAHVCALTHTHTQKAEPQYTHNVSYFSEPTLKQEKITTHHATRLWKAVGVIWCPPQCLGIPCRQKGSGQMLNLAYKEWRERIHSLTSVLED